MKYLKTLKLQQKLVLGQFYLWETPNMDPMRDHDWMLIHNFLLAQTMFGKYFSKYLFRNVVIFLQCHFSNWIMCFILIHKPTNLRQPFN